MQSITLKLDRELAARIDSEARARRTTRSQLCRSALAGFLKKAPSTKPSLLERSRDLCGVGASGRGDLSTNKAHLKGFGA